MASKRTVCLLLCSIMKLVLVSEGFFTGSDAESEAKSPDEGRNASAFSCLYKQDGYYADVRSQCRSFFICDSNNGFSMTCPQGHRFESRYRSCTPTAHAGPCEELPYGLDPGQFQSPYGPPATVRADTRAYEMAYPLEKQIEDQAQEAIKEMEMRGSAAAAESGTNMRWFHPNYQAQALRQEVRRNGRSGYNRQMQGYPRGSHLSFLPHHPSIGFP